LMPNRATFAKLPKWNFGIRRAKSEFPQQTSQRMKRNKSWMKISKNTCCHSYYRVLMADKNLNVSRIKVGVLL
jgi:hypothetical protein